MFFYCRMLRFPPPLRLCSPSSVYTKVMETCQKYIYILLVKGQIKIDLVVEPYCADLNTKIIFLQNDTIKLEQFEQ